MNPRLPLFAVLLTAAACQAPLASTRHDVLDVVRYAGTWEIALLLQPGGSEDDAEAPPEPQVLGRLEVEHLDRGPRRATASNGGLGRSLVDLFRSNEADRATDRLVVHFTWTALDDSADGDAEPPPPIRFDAQLIGIAGQQFLTVQRFTGDDWLDPWSTPLQRTFRLEEPVADGPLLLATHPLQLVWSPTALAGRFEFDPEVLAESGGIGLVQTFDDLLDYYAGRPSEEWTPMLEARRID